MLDPVAIAGSVYNRQIESFETQLPPLMMWGDFIFQLSTMAYNKLVISDAWNWAAQGRIGRQERLQYTGKKAREMRISCELYDDFVDMNGLSDLINSVGIWQDAENDPVEWLRRQADTKTPLMLVTGTGKVMGFWVMSRMDQSVDEFRGAGEFRHQTIEMTLQYFGSSLTGIDEDPAETDSPTTEEASQAVSEMNSFLSEYGNG